MRSNSAVGKDTIAPVLKHLGDEPEFGPVPAAIERAVLRLLGRV